MFVRWFVFSYAFPVRFVYLFVFNSWGRASVPRVIAGTIVDEHRFRRSTRSSKFGVIKFLWERASFSLCQISRPPLEVLPNLRHAGVFQMSMTVNFGIGLTRRWTFVLRLRKIDHWGYTNSSLLESDLKVRKYHAAWARTDGCDFDHSLQNNSRNRDNKTYVLRRSSQTRCIDSVKHTMYVLLFIHCLEMRLHCIFSFNCQ